jgi:hypothetical protein
MSQTCTKQEARNAINELRSHLWHLERALDSYDVHAVKSWGQETVPLAHLALAATRGALGLDPDDY